MKFRASVEGTFLFFMPHFLFAYYGINTAEAALSICSWNHPGYGKCREISADCLDSGNGSYKCQCSKGYWMFEGRCQKSDWCADREIGDLICKSNGTICKRVEWTNDSFAKLPFKCECKSKFVQSGICRVTELYCQQFGAKSYKHKNITLCNCEHDQFFDYRISKCQNLDRCPFIECNGKYEECHGSECVCKTSYRRDGKVCRPRMYCDSTICGSAKCEEGPEDDPKNIRCYCDSGYVLTREAGIPNCKLVRCESHSLNPCDHHCIYSADKKSSQCECFPGHTLKEDNITCERQASHKCNYNVCNSRSICIMIDGIEKCMCKNSLVGQDTCQDRCKANQLLLGTCPDKCKSIEGGFQCVCEGKYRLSKNGITCEERRMCLEGADGLRNCRKRNRTCTESPQTEEGYTCGECMHGLQEHEGNCTDLCEEEKHKRFCQERRGTCVSVNALTNEVECKCLPLFAWKKNIGCLFAHHSYSGMLRIFNSYEENSQNDSVDALWYGEGNLDWKKLDHDISKSLLTLFGQALSGTNVLLCRHDQVGENHEVCIVCQIELQLHFEDYGILERLNSHTSCRGRDNVPQMFCFIPPYLKLVPRNREIQNVEVLFSRSDVCGLPYGLSMCPASTNCVDENIGFSCRCKKGFLAKATVFLNSDSTGIMEVCQDINECETRNPCPSGTICVNTIGDFECPCEPSLFRWNVSGNPKMNPCTRACDTVTCLHGECENHDKGFYCRCKPEFSGLYCEEEGKIPDNHGDCRDNTSETTIIAVAIVEAIVFTVFIILAAVCFRCGKWSKPKKQKRRKDVISRTCAPQGNSTQNRTIDHMQMRSNALEPNKNFRLSLEEEPDEPIYADCTQIT